MPRDFSLSEASAHDVAAEMLHHMVSIGMIIEENRDNAIVESVPTWGPVWKKMERRALKAIERYHAIVEEEEDEVEEESVFVPRRNKAQGYPIEHEPVMRHHATEHNTEIEYSFTSSEDEEEDEEEDEDQLQHQPEEEAPTPLPTKPKKRVVKPRQGTTANGTVTQDDVRGIWKAGKLETLTVDKLKAYLKLQKMHVSGTKQALLERVRQKLHEEEMLLASLDCENLKERESVVQSAQLLPVEVACEVAGGMGMVGVECKMEEDVPGLFPKGRRLRKKVKQVESDDDDDMRELREPSPEVRTFKMSKKVLSKVPPKSPVDKTAQWAENLPMPHPRYSNADTTINSIHTGFAAPFAVASPFQEDGRICREPDTAKAKLIMRNCLSRLQNRTDSDYSSE